MISKAKLIETLDNLPENFSIDELVERLILIQKIEQAQAQSKEGKSFTEQEAKSMVKKWSK